MKINSLFMCNCGKKRNMLINQNATANNVATRQSFNQQIPAQRNINKQTVMFQYTGNTSLTVRGGTTGKSYRFNFPGDIQHITLDDAAGLLNVSILKKLS